MSSTRDGAGLPDYLTGGTIKIRCYRAEPKSSEPPRGSTVLKG
jgi:hypothetical protein